MKHRRSTRTWRSSFALWASAAAATAGARADTRQWNPAVQSGQWSDPASWLLAQPPLAGDEVHLNSDGTNPFTAIYDLAQPPALGDVYVQYSAAPDAAPFELRIGDPVTATAFQAQNLWIGFGAAGRTVQTAGSVAVNGSIYIGPGTSGGSASVTPSSYDISGSAVLDVGTSIVVGRYGKGVLNQSGGSVSAGQITVGQLVGGDGVYNLQSGDLYPGGNVLVGTSGKGVFNYTGGQLHMDNGNALLIGTATGGAGTFAISDGASLQLTSLKVGVAGTGVFEQYGGSVTLLPDGSGIAPLSLGSNATASANGTYRLHAGTLTANADELIGDKGAGTFEQSGGLHVVSAPGKLYLANTGSATATYTLSGGTLQANLEIGRAAPASFYQSGGSLISGTVNLGRGSLFAMSNGATLQAATLNVANAENTHYNFTGGSAHVTDSVFLGNSPQSAFNLSGGDLTIDRFLRIGNFNGFTTGVGIFNMSGGSLRAKTEIEVGYYSAGSFVQTGGVVTSDKGFVLGLSGVTGTNRTDQYSLSSGTLTAGFILLAPAKSSRVAFNQSGGFVSTPVFQSQAGTATVNLSGGTLSTDAFTLGFSDGAATVNQTGGVFNHGNAYAMVLAQSTNSTAIYNLSGNAQLNAATNLWIGYYGKATFNQNGGAVVVSGIAGLMDLGSWKGSAGTYNLTSGTLSVAQSLTVGDVGDSVFNQSGGSVTTGGDILLGNSTITKGTYNLSSGTLKAPKIDVGVFGVGTFNQTNGAVVTTTLNLADFLEPARGTYNLNGGSLSATFTRIGFGDGAATFNQSGGSFNANAQIVIANAGTQTSSLNVTGGSVTTPDLYVGYSGRANAVLTVNGGTVLANSALVVGANASASGTVNLSAGKLSAAEIQVGRSNTTHAVFNQSAGYAFGGKIYLSAADVAAYGEFNLTGGTLESNDTYVGLVGRGVFNHTAGAHNIYGIVDGNGLFIGNNDTAYGTYNLGGSGQLTCTTQIYVGALGRGEFVQTGGSASTYDLFVAHQPASSGTASLSAGTLTVTHNETVGRAGEARFVQSGGTHTIGQTLTVGTNTTGSGTFLLQGGTLAAASIDVQPTGSFTLSPGAVLSAKSFSLSGGTATLSGIQNWNADATLTATGGTLTINTDAGNGNGANLGVDLANATTTLNSTQHLRSFHMSSGIASVNAGRALVTQTLALDGTSRLDLTRGGAIIGQPSVQSIRQSLSSAYATGDWSGPGLFSSTAAANAAGAVGYALASDVLSLDGGQFIGEFADPAAIIVGYTVVGDANLDGAVDFKDLVRLAQNYNAPGGNLIWSEGDFDYDGFVGFNDLVRLAQNYGASLPALPTAGAPPGFQDDLARAFASVPEPGAISLSLAACGFALRRRRRNRSAPPRDRGI